MTFRKCGSLSKTPMKCEQQLAAVRPARAFLALLVWLVPTQGTALSSPGKVDAAAASSAQMLHQHLSINSTQQQLGCPYQLQCGILNASLLGTNFDQAVTDLLHTCRYGLQMHFLTHPDFKAGLVEYLREAHTAAIVLGTRRCGEI